MFGARIDDQPLTDKGVPVFVEALCQHILSNGVVQHNGLFAEQATDTELEVLHPADHTKPMPNSGGKEKDGLIEWPRGLMKTLMYRNSRASVRRAWHACQSPQACGLLE